MNHNEPQPPADITEVEPPDYLELEALEVWHRLAPTLMARQMLTLWDTDLFAVFCTAVAHHRRAVKIVNGEGGGILVKGDRGTTVKNPALQIVRDQALIIATLSGRFGLTPSDRASIEMPPGATNPSSSGAAAILD